MDIITAGKKFQLITADSPGYETTISLIRSAYAKAFQASVDPRPALLLTFMEQAGDAIDFLACVAFSQGMDRPFFSEQYLPGPAETCLRQALDTEVRRDQILEVGSLAIRRNGAGKHLVSHTPRFPAHPGAQEEHPHQRLGPEDFGGVDRGGTLRPGRNHRSSGVRRPSGLSGRPARSAHRPALKPSSGLCGRPTRAFPITPGSEISPPCP